MAESPTLGVDSEINIASFGVNSFVDLTPQQKRDATYSTLLARLAASKSEDPHASPDKWFQEFSSTLEKLAWIVVSSTVDTTTLQAGSVSDFVITTLERETNWNDHGIDLGVRALRALEAAGAESDAQARLDADAISSSKTSSFFQIAVADPGDGFMKMRIFSFCMETDTSTRIDHVLGHRWSESSVKWIVRRLSLELNVGLYERARSLVEQKLREKGALDDIVGVHL